MFLIPDFGSGEFQQLLCVDCVLRQAHFFVKLCAFRFQFLDFLFYFFQAVFSFPTLCVFFLLLLPAQLRIGYRLSFSVLYLFRAFLLLFDKIVLVVARIRVQTVFRREFQNSCGCLVDKIAVV